MSKQVKDIERSVLKDSDEQHNPQNETKALPLPNPVYFGNENIRTFFLNMSATLNSSQVNKLPVEQQKCGNSNDFEDQTPLHVACQSGHLSEVKSLIEKKHCNPVSKNSYGHTPMHTASLYGHLDIAKYLAEDQHCDPACKDNSFGWTPMHLASLNGHLDIAKYLVEKQQCDPTCQGKIFGRTPMHLACQCGHLDMAKYLAEDQHCDPACKDDTFGWTPMHLASQNGHLDIAKYLVEKQQCDPACKGKIFGQTPMRLACINGHLEVAEYLIEELHCDPACKNKNDGWTPMHAACCGGHLHVAKYLVEKQHCDLTCTYDGKLPLHTACEHGRLYMAKYLIEERQCNPDIRTVFGSSPLYVACKHHHLNLIIYLVNKCNCTLGRVNSLILLSDSYVKDHTDIVLFLLSSGALKSAKYVHFLFKPAFKVLVVGNSSSGKSTLIKALQSHLQNEPYWFTKRYKQFMESKVTEVESHTAGIIPIPIQTPSHGQIIMYDFAGQAEYYSSHAALCENVMIDSGSLILVVFDLSKSKKECIQELKYWKSFIDNQSKNSSINVIASHADIVKSQGQDPVLKAQQVIQVSFGEQSCYVIVIDCRLEASDGLEAVSASITGHSDKYHQNLQQTDPKVHFCRYLIQKVVHDKLACRLDDIMSLVSAEENLILKSSDLLPENIEELSRHVTTLSESGELLYLKYNQDVGRSWVILKKDVLLEEVNGTMFAPANFRQHHDISNSTGVVPLSNIRRLFSNHDPRMLVGFMTHLEFCHEIAKSEAGLISRQESHSSITVKQETSSVSHELTTSDSENFYFFPALVSTEIPDDSKRFFTRSRYKCGWCLQQVSAHTFLTSRFLHTLLLRLTFAHALKCDKEHQNIVIQRECNVWKSGIHWLSDDGVEVIVEVVEQCTAVVMVVGCLEGREMECCQYRSRLIQTILQTKEQFSGAVEMNEAFIDPNELSTYPLRNTNSLIMFSFNRLAKALAARKNIITTKHGTKQEMIDINTLLHFEPFACLTPELISELLDEAKSDLEISDDFLYRCARYFHSKINQLKRVLIPLELLGASHDQYSKDPSHNCFQVFRTWKNKTKTPTYGRLREALDKYSIFRGRNMLYNLCKLLD